MNWQPHYRDEFYSALAPAEALRRLQGSLVPAGVPLWRDDYQAPTGQFFQGQVEGDVFDLVRLPKAGKPLGREAGPFPIRGRVVAAGTGSCVRFGVELAAGSRALVWFQLALVGVLVAAPSAAVWFSSGAFPWLGLALVLGLPVFQCLGMYFTLFQEAERSRPLLVALLQLGPLPPSRPTSAL